jgi:hypothetical protein
MKMRTTREKEKQIPSRTARRKGNKKAQVHTEKKRRKNTPNSNSKLSLRHRCSDDLCSEESSLRPLDNLLVYRLRRVVHHHCSLLVVNLGVHPGVPDEVDDPLLTLVLAQVQPLGQVLDVDALVNLAVALRDEMPSRVNERLGGGDQEEVVLEHFLGLTEFSLRLLEVEVNAQGGNELGDRVAVLVQLLLDDTHQILKLLLVLSGVTVAVAIRNHSGGQVTEDPWARCLDSVDESGGEEELDERVAGGVVVEEGEKSPVNQPCPVLELGKRVVVKLRRSTLVRAC